MMSALGGVPQKQWTVLISCVSVTVMRGEGVKISDNFADVLCTCSLTGRRRRSPSLINNVESVGLKRDGAGVQQVAEEEDQTRARRRPLNYA